MNRSKRALAALVAVAALGAACSDGDDDPAPTTAPPAPSTTAAATSTSAAPAGGTLDQVELEIAEVARLTAPTAMASRPSSPDLYVAEQAGRVRLIDVTEASDRERARAQLQSTPILDLSDEVVAGGEQGLLGLTFSSDGRLLYVNFTAAPDGRTLVVEYEVSDNNRVDLSTRRELLEIPQPAANHNGGNVVTGPDGYLYVGMGDGGGSGDPEGNGQDPTTLLGSILRIDPVGGTSEEVPYGIPAGNPFANGEGAAPETWLYGVRNPWRFSFDRETGDLWVADVGQDEWEEITVLPSAGGFDAGRGANLGWDEMEGSHPSRGGENPEGGVLPIYEYGRDDGCSITGGFVYRGAAIPALQGSYLFGDYCSTGLRAIQVDAGAVIDERTWDLPLSDLRSFGQDNEGEIYALTGDAVVKLLPAGGVQAEDD